MKKNIRNRHLLFTLFILISIFGIVDTAVAEKTDTEPTKPQISVAEDMSGVMKREAGRLKEEFKEKTRSLFHREPLEWDLQTLEYLSVYILTVPQKIPELTNQLIEKSRLLGVVGSTLIFLFLVAVFYSIIGRSRVLKWSVFKLEPLGNKIPEKYVPYYISFLYIFISALIPLILLGLFFLINALINHDAGWFQLIGRLLGLWAVSSIVVNFLKEALTRNFFKEAAQYGKGLYFYSRLLVLYVFSGFAIFWIAEVFAIRPDVLALLKFVIEVSIVVVCLLFFLKKEAFLSLLPKLPENNYNRLLGFLRKYYYPLLFISFVAALFWCLGYKDFGRTILTKIWFTVAAFLILMLLYHTISEKIKNWSDRLDAKDETAWIFVNAINALMRYALIVSSAIIILSLLGLLDPIHRLMSFPIFHLGTSSVTLWIITKALLILLAFIYASRFLQSYFDYKVYPMLGVDPGLGYAINTLFKYLSLAIGVLISLKFVGIDLRFLLVFAGAAGIGIGLGLQNMAANIVSGFTIIFGGKIRKGDWIEVSDTMGVVTDVFLTSTKVTTRDNFEYLIPNSELLSSIMINYSLSSSLIRIDLPVGVSYDADPKTVEAIMLSVAENEPLVSKSRQPSVRFIEYGDNSINFSLLVWIDVRKVPRRQVRSELFFAIFEAFRKNNIEIPFPQRDLHLRSSIGLEVSKTASEPVV